MTLPLKTWLCLSLLLLGACTDREAEARRAKEEAEAKARAAAARKEMDALPKTFQSRDYFKKNTPPAKPASGDKAEKP
jgi:hypothetical protein